MPSIRILTWNSTGESFPKAASLAAEAATMPLTPHTR